MPAGPDFPQLPNGQFPASTQPDYTSVLGMQQFTTPPQAPPSAEESFSKRRQRELADELQLKELYQESYAVAKRNLFTHRAAEQSIGTFEQWRERLQTYRVPTIMHAPAAISAGGLAPIGACSHGYLDPSLVAGPLAFPQPLPPANRPKRKYERQTNAEERRAKKAATNARRNSPIAEPRHPSASQPPLPTVALRDLELSQPSNMLPSSAFNMPLTLAATAQQPLEQAPTPDTIDQSGMDNPAAQNFESEFLTDLERHGDAPQESTQEEVTSLADGTLPTVGDPTWDNWFRVKLVQCR
jgi:hypothetical protein